MTNTIRNFVIALGAFFWSCSGLANELCGTLDNGYGPFDYTNPVHFEEKLPIVEEYHFDAGVEALKGHAKSGHQPHTIANDLDYTLRAFPNHHRALLTLIRYKTDFIGARKLRYTTDCWLQRAIDFRPKDHTARMIYGVYLKKIGKLDAAVEQFEFALQLQPESAEVHYNLGLVLLDAGYSQRALHHAKEAYARHYPLLGLRNKLSASGLSLD